MRIPGAPSRAAQPRGIFVGAPLPDVAGAIVEPVRTDVCGQGPHRERVPRSAAVRGGGGDPVVAPGIAAAVVAARGPFPLRLAWEGAGRADRAKASASYQLTPTTG